jgi:hypothetical protein
MLGDDHDRADLRALGDEGERHRARLELLSVFVESDLDVDVGGGRRAPIDHLEQNDSPADPVRFGHTLLRVKLLAVG